MLGCLFGEEDEDLGGSRGDQGTGNSRGNLKAPPAPRNKTRLSGLSNLGATCYLNSLLQTLHFTPEFRGIRAYGGRPSSAIFVRLFSLLSSVKCK